MDDVLIKLLSELEHVGKANDAKTSDRSRCMLNITRDTGEFLTVLVRATASRRVLEIGTSNGYSTMWLAEAARSIGGSVTTIESDEFKIELARANFARSGMSPFIRLVHEDATRFLEQNEPGTHDLVFLDADRSRYLEWWPYPKSRNTPRRPDGCRQRNNSCGPDGSICYLGGD